MLKMAIVNDLQFSMIQMPAVLLPFECRASCVPLCLAQAKAKNGVKTVTMVASSI
jgi:hypothetical protein